MKALLDRLFGRNPSKEIAHRIYLATVRQARRPEFYAQGGVPDSVDGRFDMIVLHLFLVLRRLKTAGADPDLQQRLYDLMFADMDQALREMGVGDLSVSKHIKRMVQAFHGRVAAYESGLENGADRVLEEALARNLYGTVEAPPGGPSAIASYMRSATHALDQMPLETICEGSLDFGVTPYQIGAGEGR